MESIFWWEVWIQCSKGKSFHLTGVVRNCIRNIFIFLTVFFEKNILYIYCYQFRKNGRQQKEISKFGAKRLDGPLKMETLKERSVGLEHLNSFMT